MKRVEHFVVTVDADLEDIVPIFLESRRKDVVELRRGLANGDYEAIRIIGHTLKGSGGGYGFQTISEIGRCLERAAKEEDREAIRQKSDELAEYLERLEIFYQ
ncbi:MAG: Hpt domain-containing protein [Desulforhabdus sp.]|jgi:HPt (histidine-containing phosphotransfer) domain-containing protein|nr:Hpt domain-containing protein [Desulforhabdus sp.]